MIKNYVALLLIGAAWCSVIVGILLGNVGTWHPAYCGSMAVVGAGILMTFVPFIIGIHAGVQYGKEEKQPYNPPA